jgi:glycosyltransferase involved in cell wall biosynthesis
VKYDRIANAFATRVIAQSAVTYRVLTEWEHVKPERVVCLDLPLDIQQLHHPDQRDVDLLRARYNPDHRYPVVGVIARWIELKGVQYIIPAFERLLKEHPDALLLLFNPTGNYHDAVSTLVDTLPPRNVRVVPYETMNEALYQVFDVFVHVPTDALAESMGCVYAEALAAGVPSIFTLSGMVTSLVEHMTHCYIVPYKDSEAIFQALRTLVNDRDLARRLGERGRSVVPPTLWPEAHVKALEELYASVPSLLETGVAA